LVEPGKEEPMAVKRNIASKLKNVVGVSLVVFKLTNPINIKEPQAKISLQIGNWRTLHNIPIDRVASFILFLSPDRAGPVASLDIAFRTGSKLLTVRSKVLIENQTPFAFDAKFLQIVSHSVVLPGGEDNPAASPASSTHEFVAFSTISTRIPEALSRDQSVTPVVPPRSSVKSVTLLLVKD